MKTAIIMLTYDQEISADTLEALLDSHMDDQGVVMVQGMLANGSLTRIVADDEHDDPVG